MFHVLTMLQVHYNRRPIYIWISPAQYQADPELIINMPGYNYISIIDVVKESNIFLHDTGRFSRVISNLSNSAEQYLNLVHFIGSKNKNLALKHLFSQNNFWEGHLRNDYSMNLYIKTTSIDSDALLLFTDNNYYIRTSAHLGQNFCHPVVNHIISWSSTADYNIADILQA